MIILNRKLQTHLPSLTPSSLAYLAGINARYTEPILVHLAQERALRLNCRPPGRLPVTGQRGDRPLQEEGASSANYFVSHMTDNSAEEKPALGTAGRMESARTHMRWPGLPSRACMSRLYSSLSGGHRAVLVP